MKYTIIFLSLTLGAAIGLEAGCIDSKHSQIIFPRAGSMLRTKRPVLIGVVTNGRHKPIKHKPIVIYKNGRTIDTATTNNHGVWSTRLSATQSLAEGFHTLQAAIKTSRNTSLWMKGTVFLVDSMQVCNQFHKSGNVEEENSFINFPFEGSSINTSQPIVVGSLLDTNDNPVVGETVILSLDGSALTNVVSDTNGVFSFMFGSPLSDGNHTLDAHCVESGVDLTSVSFTIDTSTPEAPVITNPAQNELVTTGLVSIEGTAPALAMVTTFVNNDIYGVITYALESGAWQVEYELEDGEHSVTAQAESLSGNTGPVSALREFEVQEISS